MKKVVFTNEFKREFKLSEKRGKKKEKLLAIIDLLQKEEKIPEKHRLHNFSGEFKDCQERVCCITSHYPTP